MARQMTLNVRVSGALSEFVSANIGEVGTYENVSEYVRDLIRRDKERVEAERLSVLQAERLSVLQAELTSAFAAPEADYEPLDAQTIIARNARG